MRKTNEGFQLEAQQPIQSFPAGRSHAPSHLQHGPPHWLSINLLITKITVWIMFVLGVVDMAFAVLVKDDLQHDPDDYTCTSTYIDDAWHVNGSSGSSPNVPGQYHSDCRMLYKWSFIIIVAGSFSVARTLMEALPVGAQSWLTIKYERDSFLGRRLTPSKAYATRTFFSLVACLLYIAGAGVLGSSRLIHGPPADIAYKLMYTVCVGLLALSAAMSGHQALSTGLAATYLRGEAQ